jgi:elongation factor G
MKGLIWKDESKGSEYEVATFPKILKEAAAAAREKLIEAVASIDDDLMHKYLEGEEISEARFAKRSAPERSAETRAGRHRFGVQEQGVQTLLDAVVDYLPSPLDVPPVEGINPKTTR